MQFFQMFMVKMDIHSIMVAISCQMKATGHPDQASMNINKYCTCLQMGAHVCVWWWGMLCTWRSELTIDCLLSFLTLVFKTHSY